MILAGRAIFAAARHDRGHSIKSTTQLLDNARQLLGLRRLEQAERCLRQILSVDECQREALELLAVLCLQTGRADEGQTCLEQLVDGYPTEPLYCHRLATLHQHRGRTEQAIACYRGLLERCPGLVDSRYNLARLLQRQGQYESALLEYERVLAQGIERPEEVYLNMAAVYTETDALQHADTALHACLSIKPDYAPALYNLALLQEELGQWRLARDLYRQVLEVEPGHVEALARLAHGEKATGIDSPIQVELQRSLAGLKADDPQRESACYALAKVFDDCADYDRAMAQYDEANRFSRRRVGSYDRAAQEALVDELVAAYTQRWIDSIEPIDDSAPLFICGMFRSGSTLLEQILAGHPRLQAGGELRFFDRHLPSPLHAMGMSAGELRAVGLAYQQLVSQLAAAPACRLIDKQPTNFLLLGLLRALYPRALFIHTLRHPLDNCLSVYFQQLDLRFSYANSLADIGHYYRQYRRLMAHWRSLFAENLLDIAYEDVVAAPRQTVAPLLASMGLDWDSRCERFYQIENRVRTASVWQVRQPLYRQSIERWRHYEKPLRPLADALGEAGIEL